MRLFIGPTHPDGVPVSLSEAREVSALVILAAKGDPAAPGCAWHVRTTYGPAERRREATRRAAS